ncbi:BhlA/UviB family holin-like peptide [Schinkia azotoformans]|uniref:BhlA/UviB family holin-like peptide n=1 Tax=Schinkia azotoformans TaxID=1454 RepID=UPI002DB9573C|nr:BhlA/UviB family holin-like peptide [Schinkia azotoformans]MEC1715919.1 BhlA/UviB family holin-like peptide [Schinkia azotoformans]MEC1741558.1 BhlA/UviB family holin-like peptide [Schinkia azotoformans]MEC1744552.1 BhlA/UviB family holin-like peptide [Schinkia azotoformans]MEC1758457.1 BhlA/UviB family holin-like peptide [Schinkia azotoformans]MEC1765259.1 BhlA/UviB family holin-like peptide [Schinkia azotoformans]
MDLLTQIPLDTWLSQGLFAILFVWLLFDTRKEAKSREDKLSAQIDKQNEQMGRIVSSLERLEQQITNLKEVK